MNVPGVGSTAGRVRQNTFCVVCLGPVLKGGLGVKRDGMTWHLTCAGCAEQWALSLGGGDPPAARGPE